MSLPKFNKVYFPGLISLAFLPVVFVVFMEYKNVQKTSAYGLPVIWGDDSMLQSWREYQKKPFDPNTFRKFKRDTLTGNEDHDKLVLKNFERDVRKLQIFKDTINAYSVAFTNQTKYTDVIDAIDMCSALEKSHVYFIVYKNKLLVWKGEPYREPPPPTPMTRNID